MKVEQVTVRLFYGIIIGENYQNHTIMKKSIIVLLTGGLVIFASCSNDKKLNESTNESYTVIKENGQEKVVTADHDEVVMQGSDLPQNAQTFVKQHFGSETIQSSIREKENDGDEFKVQLSNGIKLEFDVTGKWKKVEAGLNNQSVGALFLPQTTRDYLSKNYQNIGIESAEQDAKGIDVDLLNGVDLKFDTNGNFVRID